jgi:hypothetical protein
MQRSVDGRSLLYPSTQGQYFAIGRLLKDLTTEDLERLLKISNLTPLGKDTLKLVIKNSNEYYRDPAVHKAVNEILSEQAEEI